MVSYSFLLVEAVITCYLISLSWYFSLPLIVLRYTKTLMFINAVGFVICLSILSKMIFNFGSSGANYAQTISYTLITVSILIATFIALKKEFTKKA